MLTVNSALPERQPSVNTALKPRHLMILHPIHLKGGKAATLNICFSQAKASPSLPKNSPKVLAGTD